MQVQSNHGLQLHELLYLCVAAPAGFSFKVTPAKKSSLKSFTPSKALLMGHETKMNMISPLASTSLFHTDIETGRPGTRAAGSER